MTIRNIADEPPPRGFVGPPCPKCGNSFTVPYGVAHSSCPECDHIWRPS